MPHTITDLLASPDVTMTPGVHDVVSAQIVEDAGFKACFISGFAATASLLGLPDVNVMTLTEQAALTRAIARRVAIPVIVDADNGYGNAVNVGLRTVPELEGAGACAIVLEDQVVPKRSGTLPGQRVIISAEEHAGKIAAAVEARMDPQTVIVARTDALSAGHDLEEALRRARMYVEAGAGAVFPATKHFHDIQGFAAQWDHSLAPLITAPTLSPEKGVEEFGAMGYKLVIPPMMALASAVWAMKAAMRHLRENGRPGGFEHMVPFSELFETVRLREVIEMETRFTRAP